MAEHINIEVREHVEKRISMEAKPGAAYSVSTGRKETAKYTGAWVELLTLAAGLMDECCECVQISCELERLEGGLGELTVTREEFRSPAVGGENEEDGAGSEGDELGTEDAPCYTSSSSLVPVNILAHPKFAGIGDLERRALRAMMLGEDEYSYLEDDDSSSGTRRIKDCIQSDAAKKAFELIGRGITEYYDVSTETTARWKGRSNKYTAGTVVETAPGGFQSGEDRNFLCSGLGVEKTGKETWSSASFRMSSAGGWDEYLYGGN